MQRLATSGHARIPAIGKRPASAKSAIGADCVSCHIPNQQLAICHAFTCSQAHHQGCAYLCGPAPRRAGPPFQPTPQLHKQSMWAHAHWRSKHRASKGGSEEGGHRVMVVSDLAEDAAQLSEELRSGPMGQAGLESRKQLCDSGLPEVEMCELAEPPSAAPAVQEAISRGRWLLGLLILQSTSSFVLDAYSELLRDHLVVVMFLTMLVGAGGNAGNQSAIKVIRGLATGSMLPSWVSARNTLMQQASVGLMLGTGLSAGGFIRVYLWNGSVLNACAISLSLFAIVMSSVLLGTGLPFALTKLGVDPANAGTSIQVLMDILGVLITCVTCHVVLDQLAAGLV